VNGPDGVTVVGASLAGLRAVEALRRRGYEGPITWIGAESTLPYDRPPLSKQVLRGELTPERVALKANYGALGVEPLLGVRATALDPGSRTITLSDGRALPYGCLVVATGASARTLPGASNLRGVHTLRTLDDALAIRAVLEKKPRVAVVGAGFIGLEVAASCRTLGLDVTVVEALSEPLERSIGSTMGRAVGELHASEGVVLRLGAGVERLLGEGDVEGLLLTDGTTVKADLVVVGIGVYPETDWLAGSGVALDRGVLCDARCRTSAPGVVACGDVARFTAADGRRMLVEHWTNAVEQANAAVATILEGDAAPPYAPLPYFWSDQFEVKLQFAGTIEPGDAFRVEQGSVVGRDLVALWGRHGKLTGVLTANNPAVFIRTRRAISQGAPFE
jgi:3-phenylpropionate/trans-cinnamate dioxygenase ferredoxin reductase subunit